MKISIEWLREYLDLPESIAQLRADLTMAGLVVESLTGTDGNAVLEIEIPANRPDCLSYIGIAREIAARTGNPARPVRTARSLRIKEERIPYRIEVQDADLCPRYLGLVLDGIRVEPSPVWMQERLEASGMRPVNNIVDITNYVLLEQGHPLHAFDFDCLSEGRILVARAHAGQRMVTLDGIERILDEKMLLINDGGGPVAIAGVMGGLHSEICQTTRRVLLECAYFHPGSIRRTSKKLGLSTEASYRFERGADWNGPPAAVARTCYLMQRLAGARIAGSLQDVYPSPIAPVIIDLMRDHAEALLGIELAPTFIESTLKSLNFKPVRRGRGKWRVLCPTYRADMELEADLIEEIARFFGYQNIPATIPAVSSVGRLSSVYPYEKAVRELLLGLGYSETIQLSFAGKQDHLRFPLPTGLPLEIRNPLTEETQFLRGCLAPGLLKAARHNFNHNLRQLRIFEMGKIFRRDPDGSIVERNALGLLGTGSFTERNWQNSAGGYDFFHIKGVIVTLLEALRCPPPDFVPAAGLPWLDDSRAAALMISGKHYGYAGALHPALEEEFKLKQPVYVAEIDFQELYPQMFAPIHFKSIPRFPAVERDLSILVPRNLSYHALLEGILGLTIPELTLMDLIDVYEGSQIPPDKVGLTLRLTFLDREGTLTVDRVQGFSDNIRAFLQSKYGAELR